MRGVRKIYTAQQLSLHVRLTFFLFLFVFNRNYASILYRLRDTASYLSKFANFERVGLAHFGL